MLKIKTKNMSNVYKQFKNGTSSTAVCLLKTNYVRNKNREKSWSGVFDM